jgi:hypothetical protein
MLRTPCGLQVEVFEYALESTSGEDLHKVLWLKSRNSEVWLDRRTNYTRSTAVMSMVGYLLGLGDRHPSNLMLDRWGKEEGGQPAWEGRAAATDTVEGAAVLWAACQAVGRIEAARKDNCVCGGYCYGGLG